MIDAPGTYSARWTRKNLDGVDETVGGWLEVREESPTHLIHLDRDFAEDFDGFSFLTGAADSEVYPVIHGTTQNGGYTAIDSREFRSKRTLGGALSDIVLRPYLLVKGSAFLHEHELEVTEVSLRFWDQNEWAEWDSWDIQNGSAEASSVVITQKAIPVRSVRVGNATISIQDASEQGYTVVEGTLTLQQNSVFNFRFDEPVSLKEFMTHWMRPMSAWVSSGTRRTSGIESMSITNSQWTYDADDTPLNTWLEVIPRNPKRKMDDSRGIQFLHKLRHFDFEKQVPRVIASISAHETAIEQFLDHVHSTPQTPMAKLTTMAQMVETFDRSLTPDSAPPSEQEEAARRVKELMTAEAALKKFASKAVQGISEAHRDTLASRLSRLDKQTGRFLRSELSLHADWKSDIALVRNSAVHGLPSSTFFLKNVIPLQISFDILMILFEARLLVAFGFDPTRVQEILTKNPHWWGQTNHISKHLGAFGEFNNFKGS